MTQFQNTRLKTWTDGVVFDDNARKQCEDICKMQFVGPHIAVMPDVHLGIGATVGSVIPQRGAIIPAAVGVDIGCGMMAGMTQLTANDLPDNLTSLRNRIEAKIPVGFNSRADDSVIINDRTIDLLNRFSPTWAKHDGKNQLGTLGGGNHFIEVCLDTEQNVWLMLHSGSRGVGNLIARKFISEAKELCKNENLPNKDLAYLGSGTHAFENYIEAMLWAQEYARLNRELMMIEFIQAFSEELGRQVNITTRAVNCHHNYASKEEHFGESLWITRKGAISAMLGELGIIPGSMGAKSYIVRGLGNADSFESASHGAGRVMSRTQAKKELTLDDLTSATEGVECRKDKGVIDESPQAYKDIDKVMAAQRDLVEIKYELKQILCVKG